MNLAHIVNISHELVFWPGFLYPRRGARHSLSETRVTLNSGSIWDRQPDPIMEVMDYPSNAIGRPYTKKRCKRERSVKFIGLREQWGDVDCSHLH